MKKVILLLTFASLALSCSNRDENNCRCYSQQFKREYLFVRYFPPISKEEIKEDTGYVSVGGKTDYSSNCKDNRKKYGVSSKETGIYTDKEKEIYKVIDTEYRVECN